MTPAAIAAILAAIQAVAGDRDLIERIIALVRGPVAAGREPTPEEWAQLDALADQGHADVQKG